MRLRATYRLFLLILEGVTLICAEACFPLRLRGGATTVKQETGLKMSTSVLQLHPDEQKPELQRVQSVLVLNEVTFLRALVMCRKMLGHLLLDEQTTGSRNETAEPVSYRIDGKEVHTSASTSGRVFHTDVNAMQVTKEEYSQRVKGVVQRNLDSWIAQSVSSSRTCCPPGVLASK